MADSDPMVTSPCSFEDSTEFSFHEWVKKMEHGTLNAFHFKEYWAKHVPATFNLRPEIDCLNITFDDDLVNKVLFLPLEQFICDNEDTENIFENIKTANSVPSLCGKVFKSGEPTYSCRDCGLDPTCVVCVDCFTKSAHRFHRYKMSTSGGGGYCDCGDEEAWKSDCFCEIHHKGKSQAGSSVSVLAKLPDELVDRLNFIIQVVLHYSYQLLTWVHVVDLPVDLQHHNQSSDSDEAELPDTYCTVLFNDEAHTYEQVIETLTKAVSCTKKAAIDYSTTTDREGRCIVKCSKYTECNHARHIIERVTSSHLTNSLKVLVMHTDVISHQIYAMKLLAWLQQILKINEGFPIVFSQVMTEPFDGSTLLESVMLSDTQLWKAARNQWHQLFISGMLMDQQCKKNFAQAFMRNYPVLIRDFMADDHDHSISVTSLSVQIFTVPTLAHALIEENDGIKTILRAFIGECERNLNENRKLAFQRNQMNSTFRRAHYMLYDLKYLITVSPIQWNCSLRSHFFYGLQSYLHLMNLMQGMDSAVRQVGQHIEYEAEWETGINLQLKVAPVSTLMLKWCGSDILVFEKSVRAILAQLPNGTDFQEQIYSVRAEIANHSTFCIEYDVGSMPVSVHLPLSRFAAGLFLYFERFGTVYSDPQFQFDNKKIPRPEHLMELPLRTLVMLAQFRAGMWRRNGYSLLNQVYFYHNVRFRDEMFDRDIMMLQVVASLIDSNEYLIHLTYKFALLTWTDEEYDGTIKKSEDDNIRQILTVAEEFLSLLLIIVSERFTPGIGQVSTFEKIKKEIIQLLCIEPMTHSNLFKMLPKDPNNETGMEAVINEVANFKKPQNTGMGKYELKPEFFKCFNPFYYHYTREEQSKAEEAQLKRKKQIGAELCCPPPVPPEFTSRFSTVVNLLQCDVMLHFLHLVFARTLNLHCAIFSEAQFEKSVHIVGVALHEEERFLSDGDNFSFAFTLKAVEKGIPLLMEECLKSPRIESQKDILRWAITKFKFIENLRANETDKNASISGHSSEITMGESSSQIKQHKSDLAAARRVRIMAQMSTMQKKFIKEHADLFKEAVLEDSTNVSGSQSDNLEFGINDPISIGSHQRGKIICQKIHTCILCREDQEVSCEGRTLVLAAFVQRSSVLSKNRKANQEQKSYDPLQLASDLSYAPHVSTCGHVMHSDCWQKFFDTVLRKEQRRPVRFGRNTSFEVDKNEYLCPLCERLSNTIIPIIPQITTLFPKRNITLVNISFHDWLGVMKKTAEEFQSEKIIDPPLDDDTAKYLTHHYLPLRLATVVYQLPENLDYDFSTMFSLFHDCGHDSPEFSVNMLDMMKLFSQTTYTVGLQCDPNFIDVRVPAMSWWSCAYTIHAIEWLLRKQNKPLFGKLSSRNALCLEAVVRYAGCSLKIFDANIVRTQCVRLLRYLLLGEHYLSSPQCALDLDAFAVLIFLVLSMPVLFSCEDKANCYRPILCPLGSDLDAYFMHLIYVFHLVQLLLTATFPENDFMEVDADADSSEVNDTTAAAHFYQDIRMASGLDQSAPSPSGLAIVRYIKSGSMPFLRCAALFFHVLTDTATPAMLQEEVNDFEFEHICKYLGLAASMHELLRSPSLKQLALSWARHPRTLHLLQLGTGSNEASKDLEKTVGCLVCQPLSVNHLIPLPMDFSDLINSASQFTCPNSDNDDSRNPTMCLVCGTVLCSQSYCCQIDLDGTMVGACTYHAHFCGAGVGIFLRIRDCKILLLSDKNKGCFMVPPYVDDYGETDQGLFRGNPLHLCCEKYEELNELWLSHSIPEQVSHMMEQSTTLPNWHLL